MLSCERLKEFVNNKTTPKTLFERLWTSNKGLCKTETSKCYLIQCVSDCSSQLRRKFVAMAYFYKRLRGIPQQLQWKINWQGSTFIQCHCLSSRNTELANIMNSEANKILTANISTKGVRGKPQLQQKSNWQGSTFCTGYQCLCLQQIFCTKEFGDYPNNCNRRSLDRGVLSAKEIQMKRHRRKHSSSHK